jgi:hypothetical protein
MVCAGPVISAISVGYYAAFGGAPHGRLEAAAWLEAG